MMIDVLDWQTSNIKHIKYYYFIIFLHFYISGWVFYIFTYSTLFNTFLQKHYLHILYFSFFGEITNKRRSRETIVKRRPREAIQKKKSLKKEGLEKPLKKEMIFNGIFCHVAFYSQAQRQRLKTKKA